MNATDQARDTAAVAKVCRCCGATYTETQWARLELFAVQLFSDEALEYRHCTGSGCKNTLARVLVQATRR